MEKPPAQNNNENQGAGFEQKRKIQKNKLVKEIIERNEIFPFTGIKKESYDELKRIAEEFPDHCIPIDPLLERFRDQGFKVVVSNKHPDSGNVFIIPSQSMDIINDNLFPRHLDINNVLNEDLKKLILLDAPKK